MNFRGMLNNNLPHSWYLVPPYNSHHEYVQFHIKLDPGGIIVGQTGVRLRFSNGIQDGRENEI